MRKNIDLYCLVTFYLMFKIVFDVNVPSKKNKHKNQVKKIFFLGIFKVTGEKSMIRSRIQSC